MTIKEKDILKFHDDYTPAHYTPTEEGYYMTIRCGFSGIYSCLNEWKDGKWQMEVLDGSTTIAYSKEQIPKEDVNEWCREKLRKARYLNEKNDER